MKRAKALLLEKIHPSAYDTLTAAGITVDCKDGNLSKQMLLDTIAEYQFLGIRSNTRIDADVMHAATKLCAIGCFCIGTNQVDLRAAREHGIVVFNSPYANTRSVAELVIAETICLMRGVHQRSINAHRGKWLKNSADSFEVRNKTLGIIGYGNIGSQVGLLAESMGMQVAFYDIHNKLPLGNAHPKKNLESLLASSHVVSIHVPKTDTTKQMIGKQQFAMMRPGSHLINAARGDVIDIDALKESLQAGHLKGAALDVFPLEPKSNDELFVSSLRGIDQVILTPHIGGSTQESQHNIALDVATKLLSFAHYGSTASAVNFPQLHSQPKPDKTLRLLHLHRNRPGVLQQINSVFTKYNINIDAMSLQTDADVGYALFDISSEYSRSDIESCKQQVNAIEATIAARVI